MTRPDWKRLGARFGVADVCVEFPFPARVDGLHDGFRAPLAERVVALREGPEGVSLQVACGLFLHLAGARLAALSEGLDEATVALAAPSAARREPTRRPPRRGDRESAPV